MEAEGVAVAGAGVELAGGVGVGACGVGLATSVTFSTTAFVSATAGLTAFVPDTAALATKSVAREAVAATAF